jgi:hypothetical protein
MEYAELAFEKFKDLLLNDERLDAKKRLENSGYWGDTGIWAALAVTKAEIAIDSVPFSKDTKFDAWVAEVSASIEKAHQAFRVEEEDPDGYGSATFQGILRRIEDFK